MSNISTVTSVHVRKLGHTIDEIRLRALDNIISKFELGFGCDCDAVKKELITKLFNWFSFESVPEPGRVLDLLLYLVKDSNNMYLNTFGKIRFQNELHELRRKLDPVWTDKINEIEEAIVNSDKFQTPVVSISNMKDPINTHQLNNGHKKHNQHLSKYNEYKDYKNDRYNVSNDILENASILDSTVPFDLTIPREDVTPVSKMTDGGIKWLAMPWQPLVTSDKGVLAAVEEALANSSDANLILHTCQFITNVMLQDFPAEVFLQRPAIVMVLHSLLEMNKASSGINIRSVIPMVLRTLHKLTRSLRFRIYYYCDPSVANRKQKSLARKLDGNSDISSETRNSPDGGVPEVNYQAYRSAGTSDHSQSIPETNDSVLQLQQMLLPTFCLDSLKLIICLLTTNLNLPLKSTLTMSSPLKIIKHVLSLFWELLRLLKMTILPSIWLSEDGVSLKVCEELRRLLDLLGNVVEYFRSGTGDCSRVIYLCLLRILVELIGNILPLEIANEVLPSSVKVAFCEAIMDGPVYLMYDSLHCILQEYAKRFEGTDETTYVKMFVDTRIVTKSIKAAISLRKNFHEQSHSEMLNTIYAAKLSLSYHKDMKIIKKSVQFLQNISRYSLNDEDKKTATKLILSLLASGDIDTQRSTYAECHQLVKSVLGVEYARERLSIQDLTFLLDSSVLTEIICYGATSEVEKTKEMSEEILVYLLKGRVQLGEDGWLQMLEAVVPVLALLQCHAHPSTSLGQCVTKMLDPDIYASIQLPYIEVLKGNLRLLFSSECDIREEAVCRLVWLLGKEKDSLQKLPRLSSLHGLPLSSLCIFERQTSFKKSEGNYQRSNLLSVLEMLNEPSVDPKMRKSALVQISVMLSDNSLHKLFINEGGLELILKIFAGALIEKDYINYPDSVVPILTILKFVASTESSVRHELSNRIDVLLNILRSLFLFPNNESVRVDGSHLLCILLYNEYIMRLSEKNMESYNQLNISLPHIVVSKMRLPFVCKSHWKTSIHRRSDISVLHSSNPKVLTLVRQFWTWEQHDGFNVLWKNFKDLQDPDISTKLFIQESEFQCMQYSFPQYYCQQLLYNIQNSTTHDGVSCAIDYLTVYLKLYEVSQLEHVKDISALPWEQTFERFLLSHPASKEDCDLFVDVLNFLQLYISITKSHKSKWITKIMKNMTKPLLELFKNVDADNQEMPRAILKLVRTCCVIEKNDESNKDSKDTWINFIELVVSTLCFGDQQHFYNLAYLDWLLTCLTYLIGQCEWKDHKNLLMSLGNTLIELIVSFHEAGTVSFMGLSITRNSIICLNHLLHQMQINFTKGTWSTVWHGHFPPLTFLPVLFHNRDPLVRASSLQLLTGLASDPCATSRLFASLTLAQGEPCLSLLKILNNAEEASIVREQASMALSNLLKNTNSLTFQYMDSLQPSRILTYIEQGNTYYEIGVLCSNIYTLATLDSDYSSTDNHQARDTKSHFLHSDTSYGSLLPHTVSHLYNCHDELRPFSVRSSDITDLDNCMQLIATPSLITAICTLLNNLIFVGQREVVRQIYEHSIDKYLFGCFNRIPECTGENKNLVHYCDTLEMYIGICTVLTNCIIYSSEFAMVVLFPPDSLCTLLGFLNIELYKVNAPRLLYLRNKLWTEIYNFISSLSLTDGQHFESLQTALEIVGLEAILTTICVSTKNASPETQMSAISCISFLLCREIQKEALGNSDVSKLQLKDTLDMVEPNYSNSKSNSNFRECFRNLGKSSSRQSNERESGKGERIRMGRQSQRKVNKYANEHGNEDDTVTIRSITEETGRNVSMIVSKETHECSKDEEERETVKETHRRTIGKELCHTLLNLFVAYNYARSKKNSSENDDKDIVVGALSNLLCISNEAKLLAMEENFCETVLMILKELYVKLNLQPYEIYKQQSERDKKIHPLLQDVMGVLSLLMNFMHGNMKVKETLTKEGLADILHKMWAWIASNKRVIIAALKLVATFTTKCPKAAQSLTLTTTLPGTGPRKTPNTVALIHVIIQLISKEIERAGQNFDNHKLHFGFHILRNSVHVHECRVAISKSNLLRFFTKIHPITTRRTKPWPLVEVYCLEFLIDFTFYDEGQLSVSKAVDALDVLIQLSKCSSSSTRILAVSVMRNLSFNATNRPRLLRSVDFINLLHDLLKNGTFAEIKTAVSILWSLISNNQKGKLIARAAGFPQSIREALGRFALSTAEDKGQQEDLLQMLEYVSTILYPSERKHSPSAGSV